MTLGGKTTRTKRTKGGFSKAGLDHGVTMPAASQTATPVPSNSCGVCSGGLVSIKVLVPQDQLGEHYKPGAFRWFAYRCLCVLGQRKPAHVFGQDLRVLGADAVTELFPDGVPDVQVPDASGAMGRAGVPPLMTTWSFATYSENPRLTAAFHKKFLRTAADWVATDLAERSDVVLFGPNGTAKTGLAVAMLRGALAGAETVRFETAKLLATKWRGTYGRKGDPAAGQSPEEDLLDALTRVDVLLIDEIGGTRLSEFVEDTLTMLVDLRQKSFKPTLLTVNVGREESDPTQAMATLLGTALFDRLRERAQFWPLVGKSARPLLKPTTPERTTDNE